MAVSLPDGPHRDAHAGNGERRGVIHPIADHADVLIGFYQSANMLDFLIRHQIAARFVDACLFARWHWQCVDCHRSA